MITRPITIILGAGASNNYGLPIGTGLVKDILSNVDAASDELSMIARVSGQSSERLKAFRQNLEQSQISTIDSWLEKNPDFRPIGKMAVCTAILLREDLTNLAGDWYGTLWNRMTNGLNTLADFRSLNKLRIITYNYDRSLEYFLYGAIQGTYGASPQEAAEAVQHMPIVHIHGMSGKPDWFNEGAPEGKCPYGVMEAMGHAEVWQKAAMIYEQIHLAFESQDPVKQHMSGPALTVRSYMEGAEEIHFIGFGFHRQNLEKIRIGYDRPNQGIYGLYRGGNQLHTRASSGVTNGLGKPISLQKYGGDEKKMIKSYLENFIEED
jgi:hypothetical protein